MNEGSLLCVSDPVNRLGCAVHASRKPGTAVNSRRFDAWVSLRGVKKGKLKNLNLQHSEGNGAFAQFVRPTPQSDSWRHDRGRIVS
jgi:hypothetical protein